MIYPNPGPLPEQNPQPPLPEPIPQPSGGDPAATAVGL